MPPQVAHDAVDYGFKLGTDALDYSKNVPILRGLVEIAEKPTKAVISSKVLLHPQFPVSNAGAHCVLPYFERITPLPLCFAVHSH